MPGLYCDFCRVPMHPEQMHAVDTECGVCGSRIGYRLCSNCLDVPLPLDCGACFMDEYGFDWHSDIDPNAYESKAPSASLDSISEAF